MICLTLADKHQNTCSITEAKYGGGSSKSKSSAAEIKHMYLKMISCVLLLGVQGLMLIKTPIVKQRLK